MVHYYVCHFRLGNCSFEFMTRLWLCHFKLQDMHLVTSLLHSFKAHLSVVYLIRGTYRGSADIAVKTLRTVKFVVNSCEKPQVWWLYICWTRLKSTTDSGNEFRSIQVGINRKYSSGSSSQWNISKTVCQPFGSSWDHLVPDTWNANWIRGT